MRVGGVRVGVPSPTGWDKDVESGVPSPTNVIPRSLTPQTGWDARQGVGGGVPNTTDGIRY